MTASRGYKTAPVSPGWQADPFQPLFIGSDESEPTVASPAAASVLLCTPTCTGIVRNTRRTTNVFDTVSGAGMTDSGSRNYILAMHECRQESGIPTVTGAGSIHDSHM